MSDEPLTSPGPGRVSTLEEETKDWGKIAAFVVLVCAGGVSCLVAYLANKDKDNAPGMYNNPDTNRSSPIGWLSVLTSIVVFGSYGILMKDPDVVEAQLDTMVFQCYSSIGISAVSLLVLTYAPWHFSWWGVAGAAILVLTQVFAFNAISALGYAVAPAIWAGLTIVISFLWGSLKFHEHVECVWGAVLSLTLLVLGILGVASCQTGMPNKIASLCFRTKQPDDTDLDESNSRAEGPQISKTVGTCFCIVTGLLNGSLMVPFHYLSDELSEDEPPITYLGSFAVGVLIVTPVFFILYFYFPLRESPQWHVRKTCFPGILTGALWAIGNFNATYATQYLGATVGFPLTQTCIVINGLWGIFFYGEMSGIPKITMFAICALVIVGASTLLTIAKGA